VTDGVVMMDAANDLRTHAVYRPSERPIPISIHQVSRCEIGLSFLTPFTKSWRPSKADDSVILLLMNTSILRTEFRNCRLDALEWGVDLGNSRQGSEAIGRHR